MGNEIVNTINSYRSKKLPNNLIKYNMKYVFDELITTEEIINTIIKYPFIFIYIKTDVKNYNQLKEVYEFIIN